MTYKCHCSFNLLHAPDWRGAKYYWASRSHDLDYKYVALHWYTPQMVIKAGVSSKYLKRANAHVEAVYYLIRMLTGLPIKVSSISVFLKPSVWWRVRRQWEPYPKIKTSLSLWLQIAVCVGRREPQPSSHRLIIIYKQGRIAEFLLKSTYACVLFIMFRNCPDKPTKPISWSKWQSSWEWGLVVTSQQESKTATVRPLALENIQLCGGGCQSHKFLCSIWRI